MNNIIQNDWWVNRRIEIKKKIFSKFKQKSIMQTSDIEKIIINSGVGQVIANEKNLENTVNAVQRIAQGQIPTITHAKKSIIGFKLREGMSIGCKVTLRKQKAWDFLFELININLPTINNFRGFSETNFDKRGKNYSIGINDLNIFPSVPFDITFKNQGIQINLVFKKGSVEENTSFLKLLDFPFNKEKKEKVKKKVFKK